MRKNPRLFASTTLGLLLLGWVAARLVMLQTFGAFDGFLLALGLASLAVGLLSLQRARLGGRVQLERAQHALEDITALLDPLAQPPSAAQPESVDEAHAPGKAHRR